MITLRKAGERGHANHGWLDSWHTFSFADYLDSQHMGFRNLRVINEDTVAGGGGFEMHPHRDMEIVSYVISGALQHRDSLGHTAIMKAGDVQRISAGTGVLHSEFNYSPIEPVHFLQIWILPETRGVAPAYDERSFASAPSGAWALVASREGREGSLRIHQDVDLRLAKLEVGQRVGLDMRPQRHGWVQVAAGTIRLNGVRLSAGDGAALAAESRLEILGEAASQVLCFDLN